ncbi:MAG: hypothetical protein AAFP20_22335, partial [Cyanobacteria bacterium J06614_10]
ASSFLLLPPSLSYLLALQVASMAILLMEIAEKQGIEGGKKDKKKKKEKKKSKKGKKHPKVVGDGDSQMLSVRRKEVMSSTPKDEEEESKGSDQAEDRSTDEEKDELEEVGSQEIAKNADAHAILKKKNKEERKKQQGESKRKARIQMSASRDSLYSDIDGGDEQSDGSDSDSSSDSSSSVGGVYGQRRQQIVVREIPKMRRFNLRDAKDIKQYLKEYEEYCEDKYGYYPTIWMRNLADFLEGDLREVYRRMIGSGEPNYEVVKERLIKQVRRMRDSVNFQKGSKFEDCRMEEGERVDLYAHRLETLARQKYGNEGIEENKELIRKFLATVPSEVKLAVNMRRKEKKRWTGKRLLWPEILEFLEDQRTGEELETLTVREKTYKNVLLSGEEVGEVRRMIGKLKGGGEYGHQSRSPRSGDGVRSRSGSRGRPQGGWWTVGKVRQSWGQQNDRNGRRMNGNMQQRGGGMNAPRMNAGRGNMLQCFRCGQEGHSKQDCKLARGECFECGSREHMVRDCTKRKCSLCKGIGHLASECQKRLPRCGNCGEAGHFARMCEEKVSECDKCGKRGHATRVCRSEKQTGKQNRGETEEVKNNSEN